MFTFQWDIITHMQSNAPCNRCSTTYFIFFNFQKVIHLIVNIFTYIFVCFFFSRRRSELKTFVTAVITTVAVLDILDVVRILPVLSPDMFNLEIFRHVYCSLGVFHELAVAIFIVSISVAVCVQVIIIRLLTSTVHSDGFS